MRSFAHWSPRYLVDRFSLFLYERRNAHHPWLTADMVRVLSTWLKPTDIGLEFGSGRSTVWFSKRVGALTSVEHDNNWYQKVSESLSLTPKKGNDQKIAQVECLFHKDGASETRESGYVGVARSFPDRSLDFVLVDGTSRDFCALESIPKIREGGILVLDNVNWFIPRPITVKSTSPSSRVKDGDFASVVWVEVWEQIGDWRFIWTTNGVTDTALFQKPYKRESGEND